MNIKDIKTTRNKIESREQKLAELCQEIYSLNMKGKFITPLPPKIIVRVLPKEHRTESGLYLPGSVQNKPVYEGIVLQTWNSYTEYRYKRRAGQDYDEPDEQMQVFHECPVKIGDRVMFAHFEGQPLSDYLDEKYYRVILDSCVVGTLNYQGDATIVEPMKELMKQFSSITTSGATPGPGVPAWEPPQKASWFTS